MDRKSALKEVLQDKKMRLLLLPILLTAIISVGATYAWFNFYSDASATVSGEVVSWKIVFDKATDPSNTYTVSVDDIKPGMDEFNSPLVITNSGDVAADLMYRIDSIRIFDDTIKLGDTVDGDVLDPILFIKYTNESLPFSISYDFTKEVINPGESSTFKISINWPFEKYIKVSSSDDYIDGIIYFVKSGDTYNEVIISEEDFDTYDKSNLYINTDAIDTSWGERAYEFRKANPTLKCIELKITVSATQHLSTN